MLDFETIYSWVKGLPIIDWHNHLDMQALTEDKPLGSLYEVWVKADPYKHRAMRICGESERLITGNASETEKWEAWKRTLPKLIGNPLFNWAKAELGLVGFFNAETQKRGERRDSDWIQSLENISLADWTPSKILRKVNAEVLSPCVGVDFDLAEKNAKVLPSLRLTAGEEVSAETLERFDAAGCRVVDISVDDTVLLVPDSGGGRSLTGRVAAFAASRGWTMLLHLGALRETSSRLRAIAGPAGGYAAMRAPVDPAAVAAFLNALESTSNPFSRKERIEHKGFANSASFAAENNSLPRTILLTLNPEAHAQLAVLAGSFVREGSPGHVQLGPAWWWCDHEEGIRDVLEKNAAYGVLSTFVGMTTDSRSFLSLVRHDSFRRILCKWVAEKIAAGAFPDDPALLRPMLEAVCYGNAKRIFAPTDD